ncbi:MAG: hypothetical protein ACFFDH_00630 [Promethearchaeota archaeon]
MDSNTILIIYSIIVTSLLTSIVFGILLFSGSRIVKITRNMKIAENVSIGLRAESERTYSKIADNTKKLNEKVYNLAGTIDNLTEKIKQLESFDIKNIDDTDIQYQEENSLINNPVYNEYGLLDDNNEESPFIEKKKIVTMGDLWNTKGAK